MRNSDGGQHQADTPLCDLQTFTQAHESTMIEATITTGCLRVKENPAISYYENQHPRY